MRAAAFVIASFMAACAGPAPAPPPRPNFLWITVEDLSPDLGCYGNSFARTPAVDRLAAEGVRYTRAFATAPVCSPARSALITGLYASSLGTQRLRSLFPLPDHVRGFPAWLREAGYHCTNNVKTDYNSSAEPRLVRESWDESSPRAHWRSRKPGRPFFAVFNDMTTHQSRSSAWTWEEFEKEVGSRLPPAERSDPSRVPVPPYYPDTPLVRRTLARYYDCIAVMDRNTDRILRELEADGLADDTIVFFFSDHGSGIPRHKRLLTDSGLRVPLLVRFPPKYRNLAPAPPGGTVDRLVNFVDFAPTLLSLAGLPAPAHFQGSAFLGPQAGPAPEFVVGARDRVDEAYDVARSVRTDRWLYLRNYFPHLPAGQPSWYSDQAEICREIARLEKEGKLAGPAHDYAAATRPIEELYDTVEDPHQIRNLAADPAQADRLRGMRDRLAGWVRRTRDLGFLPESDAWVRSAGAPLLGAKDLPLDRVFAAAERVGRLGIPDFADPDPAARYWAVVAGRRDGPALRKALSDPSPAVRIEAAFALADDAAVDLLVRELANPDLDVRLHALRSIELLGAPKARAAVEAARTASKDGEGDRHLFIRFSADAYLAAAPR
jgi:arylsulfatase A-like enzyme